MLEGAVVRFVSPVQRTLESLRRELRELDESAVIQKFELTSFDRLLKSTVSLCPVCLQHVAALVFTRCGRVLMKKFCKGHGEFEAVLENTIQND